MLEFEVWLKLLVMAIPPTADLEDGACCGCAVVEEVPLAAVEGTLRGVCVLGWAGLVGVLISGVCKCLRAAALGAFGVVMALFWSRSDRRYNAVVVS